MYSYLNILSHLILPSYLILSLCMFVAVKFQRIEWLETCPSRGDSGGRFGRHWMHRGSILPIISKYMWMKLTYLTISGPTTPMNHILSIEQVSLCATRMC